MLKNRKPYTNENGYTDSKLLSDEPDNVQSIVLHWIANNIYPRKAPLHGITSYWIKHQLSHDTGIYLTNNQFKDAMMLSGYNPVNDKELNCEYCISRKSPLFDRRRLRKVRAS